MNSIAKPKVPGRLRSGFRNSLFALLWIAGGSLAFPRYAAATPCSGLVSEKSVVRPRAIEANDLLRLRDIGYSYLAPAQQLLGLSPDGNNIAFVMYRGDPKSNLYCEAVLEMPLRPGAQPRVIDESDEIMLDALAIRGMRVDYGYPTVVVPKWSPDGKWLAYLKRKNGQTQLWRAPMEGGAPQIVSHSEVGVDLFAWSSDGRSLIYADRPGLHASVRASEEEGKSGYLFDDRIIPYSSISRPAVPLPQPYHFSTVDLTTGETRKATPEEKLLIPVPGPADPSENMRHAVSSAGLHAWTQKADPAAYLSTVDLWAELPGGAKIKCPDPACVGTRSYGINGLWWSHDGRQLIFIRREGWGGSETGIYRWQPGTPRAKHLLATNDLLLGCTLDNEKLLCAREGSTTPRRLVGIDLATGKSSLLFDPNPDFASIRLGSVERLHWRNEYGVESFGDLVLPPGYRPGKPLPLIVVQYITMGFLRGGMGDEYPIQLIAAAGYAVLSFQAPPSFSTWDGSQKSFEQAVAETTRHWSTRRNILSSLVTGIDLLKRRGVIDPERIGISGVSDGSTTIQFALVNKPGLFKVASMGSCCVDPTSFMLYGGTGLAAEFAKLGFPPARGPASSAWNSLSLALNAGKIHVPMLLQLADHEYLISLDTYMSLKAAHDPIEMYIFPDEYHLKWQPEHRAAIYARNMDWFNFWLKNHERTGPEKQAQYMRWQAMRLNQSRERLPVARAMAAQSTHGPTLQHPPAS